MSRRANKANRRATGSLPRKAWEPRSTATNVVGENVSMGLLGMDAAVLVAALACAAATARRQR